MEQGRPEILYRIEGGLYLGSFRVSLETHRRKFSVSTNGPATMQESPALTHLMCQTRVLAALLKQQIPLQEETILNHPNQCELLYNVGLPYLIGNIHHQIVTLVPITVL